MIRFTNDYSQGCHPAILQALTEANLEGNFGYSTDPHCERARALICDVIGQPSADVHLLVGGTQTNTTAIAAFLRPHEAVIAAETGHVCTHETGAIEATGHKCIAVPSTDGKLTAQGIHHVCLTHPNEHSVKPKMVYISNTTEVGTVYTEAELSALRAACDELGLWLYLDGARIGSALAAGGASLQATARLCDAFYIGGTKNGAMFGEALCILNPALKPDFRYHLKQHGGMLAKGWQLGVQFEVLFGQRDAAGVPLFLQLAQHENDMATQLTEGIAALGFGFSAASPSNQLFPSLPNAILDKMRADFHWEMMNPPGESLSEIRLVTSWATTQQEVDAFLAQLKALV